MTQQVTIRNLLKEGYRQKLQKIVFPTHLNNAHVLFGGVLLAWIDEAAYLFANEHMGTRRVVTKKISEVIFTAPGLNGDIVQVWCKALREGNTSFTIEVIVDAVSIDNPVPRQICECEVVFVALDDQGKPTPWEK